MIQPNRKTRRTARLLGAVSVAALAVGLMPISPASAAITVDDACGEFIPEDGFTDTGAEDANALPDDVEDAVDCLVAYGITTGKTATTFDTGGLVTRGQLATFVLNILDQVEGFERPANAPDAFPDDETSVHEDNINDAAALGIIQGFNDGTFRPTASVTRAQMATFIVNTLEEAGVTVPAGDDAFDDDNDSVHEDNINRLEQLDIVDGEADGNYNPERPVTRGTMAFFLVRTLEVLVDAGLITPIGGTTNQDFTVSPTGARTGTTSSTATTNEGRQSFTVTGITSSTADVALIPCANVTDDGGVISFRDVDGTPAGTGNNQADLGTTPATIETVQGGDAPTGANGDTASFQNDVAVVNGAVQFTVDSLTPACVVAVVFDDANDNNQLDLDANNQPTEAFVVTGPITFNAAEAAGGTFPNSPVNTVDKTGDSFTLDLADADPVTAGAQPGTRTFFYDANDSFVIDGVPSTFSTFEAELSGGDSVAGTYAPEPGAVSSFQLTNANPTITTVTAENGTDANSNDVTVTVTFPANSLDSVIIQRAPVSGGTDGGTDGTVGTFTTIATITPTAAELAAGSVTFVDNDVPVGTFRYRAAGVNDGDQGAFVADPNNEASTTPAADTAAPLAIDTVQTTSAGLAGDLGTGDVFKIVFNETLAAPTAGDSLRVRDTDGTIADIVNGTNATFTLNAANETVNGAVVPAGRVLTVTLTGAPTIAAAGTIVGVQLPADIIDQGGNTDLAGNAFVPATAGQDVTIDADASDNQTNSTDTTSPNIQSSVASASTDSVVLTYTEAVVCDNSAAAAAAFGYTDVDNTDTAPLSIACNGSSTVTLTFADLVIEVGDGAANINYTDENLALDANDIRDVANNNQANVTDNSTPTVQP